MRLALAAIAATRLTSISKPVWKPTYRPKAWVVYATGPPVMSKKPGSRKRECDGEDQETAQNKNPGTEITGLRDRDGRQCKNARSNHAVHRSEEHPSELQSLMRISYAVFCLKKNKQ